VQEIPEPDPEGELDMYGIILSRERAGAENEIGMPLPPASLSWG
jgi:hypothetical protein